MECVSCAASTVNERIRLYLYELSELLPYYFFYHYQSTTLVKDEVSIRLQQRLNLHLSATY